MFARQVGVRALKTGSLHEFTSLSFGSPRMAAAGTFRSIVPRLNDIRSMCQDEEGRGRIDGSSGLQELQALVLGLGVHLVSGLPGSVEICGNLKDYREFAYPLLHEGFAV